MSATQTEPTVFVVDDDPEMRNSLKWLIESVRLPVEVFECAEAFLQAFKPLTQVDPDACYWTYACRGWEDCAYWTGCVLKGHTFR